MQSLFGNPPSTPLVWAAAFLIIFILLALFAMVLRKLAGARLNVASGGRTRQPRLGIVDAFDLDRQRQLVIVRRDNVEHLVMIGGPNDLVIEQGIIRSGGAILRETSDAARPDAPRAEPVMAVVRNEPNLGEPAPMPSPPVMPQPIMPPPVMPPILAAQAEPPPQRPVPPPPQPVQPPPIAAVPPPLRELSRSMPPPPPPPVVRPPGPAPAPVLRPSPERRPLPMETPTPGGRNALPPLPETVVDPRRGEADRIAAAAAAAVVAAPRAGSMPERAGDVRDVAPAPFAKPEPAYQEPVALEVPATLPATAPEPAPVVEAPAPQKAADEVVAPPQPAPPPPAPAKPVPVTTPEMDDMARRLEEALKKPFAGIKAAEPASSRVTATPPPAVAAAPLPKAELVAAAAAPVAPPPAATAPPEKPTPPAAPIEVADFDSLEAEMSRLLGRDPGPPKP